MSKKAQAIGQVFIYIVAALTFALVTIFGYKAVGEFLEHGEQVALISFKNDIENAFDRISTQYGSVRVLSFTTPIEFRKICFVDIEKNPPAPANCNFNAIACDYWSEQQGYERTGQNVFLSPHAEVPIKVSKVRTRVNPPVNPDPFGDGNYMHNEDYLCLNIHNGNFRVRLEGLGDRVLVKRP